MIYIAGLFIAVIYLFNAGQRSMDLKKKKRL